MFSRLRLGTQLWLILLLLLAAASAGLTWYSVQVRTHALSNAVKQRLRMKEESLTAKAALLARNTALGSTTAALMTDFEFLQGVMDATVDSDDNILFGYIANSADKAVVHSDKKRIGTIIKGSGSAPSEDTSTAKYEVRGDEILEAVAPVIVGKEKWGAVHYGVSLAPMLREAERSRVELRAVIRQGVIMSVALAFGLFVVAVIITILVARRVASPLRTLEATVQRVLAGSADARVDVPPVFELARLANGFNFMLDRLRDRDQQMRAERLRAELIAEGKPTDAADAMLAGGSSTGATDANAESMPTKRLRTQLAGLMFSFTVMSVLVLGGVLLYRVRSDLNRSLAEMSEQIRKDLADKGTVVTRNAALAASQAAEGRDFLFLVQLVQSTLTDDTEIVSGFVEDPSGRVLIHNDPQKTGTVNEVAEHKDALKNAKPQSRLLDRDGSPLLEVTAPIEVAGEAWGTLSFGLSHDRLEKVLAEVRQTQADRVDEATAATGAGVGVLVLIAALAAWLASRRIVGPLDRLTADLEKIRAGDMKLRVRVHSCREFSFLSMSINELTSTTAERDEEIQRAVERAETHANRVALHAKLVAGEVESNPVSFEVLPLVDEVRDSLKRPAKEKGITIDLSAVDGSAKVEADRWMLGQILFELVDNAINFGDPESTVTVASEPVDVEGQPWLRIHVRNKGIRLSKNVLKELLKPKRGEDAERHKALGVAIARQMVALNHGKLAGESDGATKSAMFTVELPIAA